MILQDNIFEMYNKIIFILIPKNVFFSNFILNYIIIWIILIYKHFGCVFYEVLLCYYTRSSKL